ncbi:MAG: hypothetical protein GTO40_15305 [Deltaproteobacteria bacterium]|nr:hypothetical protein [Deltaproteobacteria bacterium]
MLGNIRSLFMLLLLLTIAIVLPRTAVAGGDAADFYKNNRIKIVVQYGPGGGTDIHARWLARHLPRFTGGKAIVQNQPGAGGIIAYNKLYNAKPDGLNIITAHTKLVAFDIFGRKGVRYKFQDFPILGRTQTPEVVLFVRNDLPTDLKALRKMDKIRIGESSPFFGGLMAEALNLPNVTLVPGYQGIAARVAAMRRNELDGAPGGITSIFRHKDVIKPLVSAFHDKRAPEVPDIGKLGQEPGKSYASAFAGLMWTIITTPGTPKERTAYLEKTFQKLTQDPQARAEAKKLNLSLEWASSPELRKMRKVFTDLSPKERKELKHITEKKYVGAIN